MQEPSGEAGADQDASLAESSEPYLGSNRVDQRMQSLGRRILHRYSTVPGVSKTMARRLVARVSGSMLDRLPLLSSLMRRQPVAFASLGDMGARLPFVYSFAHQPRTASLERAHPEPSPAVANANVLIPGALASTAPGDSSYRKRAPASILTRADSLAAGTGGIQRRMTERNSGHQPGARHAPLVGTDATPRLSMTQTKAARPAPAPVTPQQPQAAPASALSTLR